MFMRIATTLTVCTALALPAAAEDGQVDELFELLQLPDIIDIMRQEGLSYGDSIGADLFAGPPSPGWTTAVDTIYDEGVMTTFVREDFEIALGDADLTPMLDFFGSERGQMILSLEVGARRAMLDDAVDEAAREAATIAAAEEDPRMALVEEFITINDLIETNVAGALNSNLAFYAGLVDGGAFGGALSEDQILSDVWSQEGEIRESSGEWIYSFLYMAYAPLEDEDLEAYIAFSQSDAGRVINRVMFESFDRLFNGISRSLGRAAAAEMTTQDL